MASIPIGFSIPEEEVVRLDQLVDHFSHGNRSAFLRLALRHMEVLERAEQLDALADHGAWRLASKGLTIEDIPARVKRVLSTPKQA